MTLPSDKKEYATFRDDRAQVENSFYKSIKSKNK